MEEWNFVRKEKFRCRCRRQDENSECDESTEHLSKRRCRLFRFLWNDRRQRNSQLATDGLTPFDFAQAIAHLLLERDWILRPVFRIFAEQVDEEIVQHFWRTAQFGQTPDPQTRFHSADCQRRRAGEKKTHCRAEGIHFRSEIDLAIEQLLGTGELWRNRRS